MLKAVLFDLDGVITQTPDLHYRALNAALLAHGCAQIEMRQHKAIYNGLPTKVKLQMLQDRGLVPPGKVSLIAEAKRQFTRDLLNSALKFDPGVFCLISGLVAAKFKWAVVTNAVPETAIFCLTRLCLPVPDSLVTNEDAVPKPDPSPYLLACRQIGVEPREALAVEDGKIGIESAKKAGCKVLEVRGPGDLTPEVIWRELGG